jgi:hypothetical protein
MTFTLKKDLDIRSLTVQHNILLGATMLLQGREGVLETEKRIFLMLSIVDTLVEEDILQLCNDDERNLTDIIIQEIEPYYETLKQQEGFIEAEQYMTQILLKRCQEIWDNQHSAYGVFDAILTTISTLNEEDKKAALTETAKIAEKVIEKRTEVLEEQTSKANDKLEALVQQYQRKSQEINQKSEA